MFQVYMTNSANPSWKERERERDEDISGRQRGVKARHVLSLFKAPHTTNTPPNLCAAVSIHEVKQRLRLVLVQRDPKELGKGVVVERGDLVQVQSQLRVCVLKKNKEKKNKRAKFKSFFGGVR